MAIRDIFRINRKTFINPTGWLDYDGLKAQNKTIWDILKGLFTTPKPVNEETFAEAMQRLELSEADIQSAIKNYRYYALIFFILGLIVFLYAFYLLFSQFLLTGWSLGLATSGLFFSQAFRYDFWAMQMRQRKLGMTFADWKRTILGDKRISS